MSQNPGSIKESLLVQNEEYRRLDEQHIRLEKNNVLVGMARGLGDELATLQRGGKLRAVEREARAMGHVHSSSDAGSREQAKTRYR